MKQIRWALIGCGSVAEHKGGPALYNVPNSTLTAVMSRDAAKAQSFAERHGAQRWHSSVSELINDDIDAVYIATPPNVHADLTIQCAKAGKHVLCEKPMAATVADAQTMIDACGDKGVQLMIAYYRRFYPIVAKIKETLDAGLIGTPLYCRVIASDQYSGNDIWRVDPNVAGGGFLFDIGSHRLDLLAYLFGMPRDVAACVDTNHFDIAVDDTSSAIFRYATGLHAQVHFSWNMGIGLDEFEIGGSAGRITATHLEKGQLDIVTETASQNYDLPRHDITHYHLVEHFVQCLRENTPNRLSGREGIKASQLMQAMCVSSATRRTITVENDQGHE